MIGRGPTTASNDSYGLERRTDVNSESDESEEEGQQSKQRLPGRTSSRGYKQGTKLKGDREGVVAVVLKTVG